MFSGAFAMKMAVRIVLCLGLWGCSDSARIHYPLFLRVQAVGKTSGLITPSFLDAATIIGFERRDAALVIVRDGIRRNVATLQDSVLGQMPVHGGYLVVTQRGDSVWFICWNQHGQKDTLGMVRSRGGTLISSTVGSHCLWLSEEGDATVVDIPKSRIQPIGRVLIRSDATVRLAHTDSLLIVLMGIMSQFTAWEGITMPGGRKQYSTLVPLSLTLCAADQRFLVGILSKRTGYAIEWYARNEQGEAILTHSVALPTGIFEPRSIALVGDTAIALFRNGIVIATPGGVVGAYDSAMYAVPYQIQYALRVGNTLTIGDHQTAVAITLVQNPWWWIEQSVPIAYRILIGLFAVAIAFVLLRRLGRHKRLVWALFEKGGSGGLFLIDRRGRLQRINEAARRLLGLTSGVPLGRPMVEYLDQRWIDFRQAIEQAMQEQRACVKDVVLDATEEEHRYLVYLEPIFTGINRFEGVLVSVLEVTAQYEQWRLLHWAQIAHDMQTNLATIRLSAEQLSSVVPPSHQQHYQRILRQTRILLDRVRDLIVLGRGDKVHLEECVVEQLFEEVVSEVKDTAAAQISFVIRPTSLVLRLDRRQIASAVRNALTNAVKAIGDRPGTVELWAEVAAESVVLGIRDNGCGMDEETLRHFLRPFFTTRQHGYGIGSMIMQRAIESHGGTLEVQSCAGCGTTVLFHLPRTLYVRHER